MISRQLESIVKGQPTKDGAGVNLTRALTQREQARLDPYLMLDEIVSDNSDDYIAGFPSHPHRGFETITYMITGSMNHKDSSGGEGKIESGGVQWMTAARGVIHSELPAQASGLLHGFQLWLNLPAAEKLKDPAYRDIPKQQIDSIQLEAGLIKVLGGQFRDHNAVLQAAATQPLILDAKLNNGVEHSFEIPKGHNAFIYVYQGDITVGETQRALTQQHLGILSNHSEATGVTITANQDTGFLLIAGKPLGEPIYQYGPFVMNSVQEIEQAIRDYNAGVLTD